VTPLSAPLVPPAGYAELNSYSRIIVDEALRRGITVEVVDPEAGELMLEYASRKLLTVESLSELTSAVAFRRCDHKGITRAVWQRAGLTVPSGRMATFDHRDEEFLAQQHELVVKPARGEQGWGITVGVVDSDGLKNAVEAARRVCPDVLLEARCHGDDLRVVVIDAEVVAAAVRRPPAITGDGVRTIAELVDELSRQRQATTDGASQVPLDEVTADVVRDGGYEFDDVLPDGHTIPVRRTANLHTGGTIVDVTDRLHPALAEVAVEAAVAVGAPVLGLDLIVADVEDAGYHLIEANEQPGLANHEPRPTAARFVDLLFPETRDGPESG
jgi:GNAT-family acetyltransferase (TIGR03103 family)